VRFVDSVPEMSTPSPKPGFPGAHLELPVDEQLRRARPWEPAEQPVLEDLTDEEEADFLNAIAG
jgi:hypothetical protein